MSHNSLVFCVSHDRVHVLALHNCKCTQGDPPVWRRCGAWAGGVTGGACTQLHHVSSGSIVCSHTRERAGCPSVSQWSSSSLRSVRVPSMSHVEQVHKAIQADKKIATEIRKAGPFESLIAVAKARNTKHAVAILNCFNRLLTHDEIDQVCLPF